MASKFSFTLSELNLTRLDHLPNSRGFNVVLVGPIGSGKTQFLKKFVNENRFKFDTLRVYSPCHFEFDDMKMKDKQDETAKIQKFFNYDFDPNVFINDIKNDQYINDASNRSVCIFEHSDTTKFTESEYKQILGILPSRNVVNFFAFQFINDIKILGSYQWIFLFGGLNSFQLEVMYNAMIFSDFISLDNFKKIYHESTKNHGVLAINVSSKSDKLEDKIFHYSFDLFVRKYKTKKNEQPVDNNGGGGNEFYFE